MELTLSHHPTTFADASEKSFPVVEEKEHQGSDGYKPELYIYWEPNLKANTNGLIRQYCTKASSFADITDRHVDNEIHKLIHQLRKTLNYTVRGHGCG